MVSDAPAWVRVHSDYFGNRFNEKQYRTWSDILTKERAGTHEMLLDAVNQMIRSSFSGYLEDHLKYLQSWVTAHAQDGGCPDCGNMGLIKVPNRGRLPVSHLHVLCTCPRRQAAIQRNPSAATIEQYERLYGRGWREPGTQHEMRFPRDASMSDVYSARNAVGIAL
jgi:hypothetical protein